jgi:hypothetical protein
MAAKVVLPFIIYEIIVLAKGNNVLPFLAVAIKGHQPPTAPKQDPHHQPEAISTNPTTTATQ